MTAQVETPLEEHNREWNLAAARIAAVLSAVLTLGGWVLDWVLHPALVWDFLVIRGIAASLALATILLTPASWAKRYSQLLFFLPIFIAALAVQVMIEFLGGYASTYYAGLNLCVLGFAVTVRVPTRIAAAASMSIIALWLFPALIRPGPIAFGPFFNNLFFLIGTASIATASSELHYRLARREFEAQHELESANHQLRELHETRSRFFANITHELRTPLTLILAPLEDLLLRHSKDKMHGEFEAMHRNGMRLLRQINALLDLARVDAGQFRLRVDEIKLDTLLESTFSSFQAIARRKKVDLRLEGVRPGVTLHGDQEKLDLVFTNLLANAVKFTPEGGQITLGIETDTDWVSISVRDSGIGIPQDQLERIFDRFAQVDSGTNRRYEGAGIGLSLVKEVVEMHRGQVTVSSVLGQGTEFVIRLRRGAMSFPDGVIDRRRGRHTQVPYAHAPRRGSRCRRMGAGATERGGVHFSQARRFERQRTSGSCQASHHLARTHSARRRQRGYAELSRSAFDQELRTAGLRQWKGGARTDQAAAA
jgi:signal transduction histidine kinase